MSRTEARKKSRRKRKELFLAQLRRGASVGVAATAAGIARSTAYMWRSGDTPAARAFAAAWDDAYEHGTDMMEAVAVQRATAGVERPVFQGGVQVGTVREYSDTLLMQQLNARRPEKYRQNHKIQHEGGVHVVLTSADVACAVSA